MAVNHIEIKNFLVFKEGFSADFCPGLNVLIGGNGTGKTTLLRAIYDYNLFPKAPTWGNLTGRVWGDLLGKGYTWNEIAGNSIKVLLAEDIKNKVFIPEKDILEHAKGLLPFIEQKETGFSWIYRDALIKAQDVPTREQSETQQKIREIISGIIGGEVQWDQGDSTFYTIKANGNRIPFAAEASGFKKLGHLGLLVACGQLESGSLLCWDEPENSLNPELVPVLADILSELSRNGVQIFLATHSEILASYLDVLRKDGDNTMFYSLYRDGERIKYDRNERFDLLTPNNLTAEQAKLYECEVERGLGR